MLQNAQFYARQLSFRGKFDHVFAIYLLLDISNGQSRELTKVKKLCVHVKVSTKMYNKNLRCDPFTLAQNAFSDTYCLKFITFLENCFLVLQ